MDIQAVRGCPGRDLISGNLALKFQAAQDLSDILRVQLGTKVVVHPGRTQLHHRVIGGIGIGIQQPLCNLAAAPFRHTLEAQAHACLRQRRMNAPAEAVGSFRVDL